MTGTRGRASGYTLVEVMVAAALIALTAAGLYSGLAWGMKQNRLARENVRATQIILEKMETVRAYTWDQLFPTSDPDELEDPDDPFDPDVDPHTPEEPPVFRIPGTFTAYFEPGVTNTGALVYQGVIEIVPVQFTEPYAESLVSVRVGVSWASEGLTHYREAKTLFAENGMQNNLTR